MGDNANVDPRPSGQTPGLLGKFTNSISEGWNKFFDDLEKDPALRATMIQAGSRMMQPIQPNQTFAGQMGGAIGDSALYLQKLRAAEEKRKHDAQLLLLAQQKADIDATKAGTQDKLTDARIKELGSRAGLHDAKAEVQPALAEAKVTRAKQAGKSGAKVPSKLQYLREIRDAYIVQLGLDANNPKHLAVATTLANQDTKSYDPQAEEQKAKNRLAASTALPGQEGEAAASISANTPSSLRDRALAVDPNLFEGDKSKTAIDPKKAVPYATAKDITVQGKNGLLQFKAIGEVGDNVIVRDANGKLILVPKDRIKSE